MIGFFDSGVGGLSIFREVHHLLPHQPTIYVGDQEHVPYGSRPLTEVRKYTTEAVRFLIQHEANPIVIACNTASGAALQHVRNEFPNISFVGLVPAVKPAAESTQTGRIGVLATPGTFRGKLYLHVKNEFAADVIVYQDTVPGLVEEIEKGNTQGKATLEILRNALLPMIAKGIDRIVLGCTHYPFAQEAIQSIVGSEVKIVEPGDAVARRVETLLKDQQSANQPVQQFFSTGDTSVLETALSRLLKWNDIPVGALHWNTNGSLGI